MVLEKAERLVGNEFGCVIAYHPLARQVGERILADGGNAADAFIATTIAENVLAEGASTLAGPLGVLIYRAPMANEPARIEYLDADFNDPLNPQQRALGGSRKRGKSVLVPGAPLGLWELAAKYGSKSFSELLAPAVALAEDGFRVPWLMAAMLKWRQRTLKSSEYGRRTFFLQGKPLRAGQLLRQPDVARFLQAFANQGPSYIYRGEWGRRFLETVQSEGGLLTPEDLAHYAVRWCDPWVATYRHWTLCSSSGTTYGGPWVLLALKTLEHASDLSRRPPYWSEANGLETIIRVARQVWSEKFLFDHVALHDRSLIESELTSEHGARIWQRVQEKALAKPMGIGGSHSYHIIVSDRYGNIVSGTTTIESEPWGEGIFVEGVPLTSAGKLRWNTLPGQRRLSPFCMHFVLEDGKPRIAIGCISDSLVEAAFQLLVNVLDYNMSVEEAVTTPRFGTFSQTMWNTLGLRLDRNRLDPRVNKKIVKDLKKRGIRVTQGRAAETGLGAVLLIKESQAEGATMPLLGATKPFEAPEAETM